jgi:hypothetical protein
VILFVFLAVRIAGGYVNEREFETEVRNVIHMNPLMKDEELKMRLARAATLKGVELDPASVRADRGGYTSLAAGGISNVHLRFTVSTPLVITTWRRMVESDVRP